MVTDKGETTMSIDNNVNRQQCQSTTMSIDNNVIANERYKLTSVYACVRACVCVRAYMCLFTLISAYQLTISSIYIYEIHVQLTIIPMCKLM